MHSLAMTLGTSALVLKEFSVNKEGPEYVHIVARKSGLISWLLTMIGIDATTTFRVFADRIEFEAGSLSGKLHTTMPLRSISIATCGYTKPFILLVLGGICVLAAFATFGLTLLLAALFFLFYFLNKALLISVVSNSSWPASICFKRSVIEGVNVEYEQAQEAITLINELTLAQASK